MNICLIHQQQYYVYCSYCGTPKMVYSNATFTSLPKPEISVEAVIDWSGKMPDECYVVIDGKKYSVAKEVFVAVTSLIKGENK